MRRRTLLKSIAVSLPSLWLSRAFENGYFDEEQLDEAIIKGPFEPNWDSLQKYRNSGMVSKCKVWHVGTLGTAVPAGSR